MERKKRGNKSKDNKTKENEGNRSSSSFMLKL